MNNKYRLLLFSSAIFFHLSLSAQQVVPLYDGAAPNAKQHAIPEKIENRNGIELTSQVSEPVLTVYKPSAQTANGAAVIICQCRLRYLAR